MSISLYSVAGSAGVLLIVASYLLLMVGKVSSNTLGYSVANALGAFLIIVSLVVDFNFPAMLIELFWLGISLYGIFRALSQRRAVFASGNSPLTKEID